MRPEVPRPAAPIDTARRAEILAALDERFEAVLLPARRGGEVPPEAIELLLRAMEEFRVEWQDEDVIPKRAASWFSIAHEMLSGSSQKYTEVMRRRLQDAASRLFTAIARSVSTGGPEKPKQ